MDQVDRQLLTAAQRGIPLVPDPFAVLGAELDLGGEEVRTRLARLREAKVVRQISAIFDSGRLGYKTSLVAMKLPADRLQAAAELINLHPGVSHNYRRNHDFNLWFTIAVPPGRDLQEEVAVLAEHVRAESCRPLPTLRLFKIGVHFDLAGEGSDGPAPTAAPAPAPTTAPAEPLGADLRQVVAVLQRHLPLGERPVAALAAEAPG
ncbi:MAG TPA: Lrp/AsnC family transcriptional regulator, partial [Armatimonadetes bacterium]|nr:Lrp/AsnC family transcriptional regulator [Armatimonadota bacterium]